MDQSFGNLGAGAGSSSGGSNSKAAAAAAAVSSSSFLQLPLSTAAAASPAYYGAPLALLHHHGGPASSQQQQSPYVAKHTGGAEMSAAEAEAIKAKIVAHPQYSALLAAYLDCQKVGAPPDVLERLTAMAAKLDARPPGRHEPRDPELDQFMEAYCNMLVKYREELTRPIDEAMDFLKRVEAQLDSISGGGGSSSARLSFTALLLDERQFRDALGNGHALADYNSSFTCLNCSSIAGNTSALHCSTRTPTAFVLGCRLAVAVAAPQQHKRLCV